MPPGSGHISCNGKEIPTNEYRRIEIGTVCKAEANSGFAFSSWIQNLGKNSTKTISPSTISDSAFNSLLTAFGYPPRDNAADFTVAQHGTFTANFKELRPLIPPEYLIPLYGIIVSSIVGWSIPSIIGWIKTKRQGRTLNDYHKRISYLYKDGKLDQNDIEALDKLKIDIADAYAKGRISDQHYQNLKSEISILYEEIYRKRIDWLNGKQDRHNSKLLYQIKHDIEDAFAKGKISDEHYNLLNKKIESFVNTTDNNNNKTTENKLETTNQTHISKRSPI